MPFVDAAFDGTQIVAEPDRHVIQQTMLPPLTLLRGVGTGQAYFAISGVGEVFLHQLRHFGSTLLNADEDRRTTSLRLDAVGKLAACFGQEGRGEGYDGHGG